MTTPTKTCALGVGTRQLQRNTKKQKEQTANAKQKKPHQSAKP